MGERFAGRYELVDHLGDGGTGSVWRAWDARRGTYVAAKLLRQRDAGALLRFVREQSLRVSHPHVVAPTGWAAEDDDVLLTMDLVAGGSVATLIGDHHVVPPATALLLLDQLLDALGAVHAAGLVHRDVKPANLLLEPTGTAPPYLRLADFGIAVALTEPRLTDTGFVVGTPGHVAPEVLRGAPPDPRQDLWSVGVVGAQLLTGVRPVPGQHLPGELGTWLTRLLDDDPDHRPGDVATARAQLRALPAPPAGEPVEVFDQLGPLPPGWGPDGPLPGARPPATPAVPPRVVTRPLPVEPDPQAGGQSLPAPGVAATPAAAARASVEDGARRPLADGRAGGEGPPVHAGSVLAAARPTSRPGPLRLLLVALLLVAGVAAFVAAARDGGGVRPGSACTVGETGTTRTAAGGGSVTCTSTDGGATLRWTAG